MMEERNQLIEKLQEIRQDRLVAMEKLEMLTHRSNVPLEELLPTRDTNSWEILSLRDQMVTLFERMNLQTTRNEMLVHLLQTPQPAPQSKKKISIATLPEDGYKERDE